MTHPYDALRATLARIHALCEETGSSHTEALDAATLARAAALPVDDVQALLAGEELADRDTSIDARVCLRVRALFEARVAETGRRPADVRQEIQNRLQISHEWARRLCSGSQVPNVRDLHGLREYFGVPTAFHFTDSAATALNSALQPTLRRLEAQSGDLVGRYLEEFGQVVIAHRGRPLTKHEIAVMTTFVGAVLDGTPGCA
ncbi:hypothetical protein AB0H51_27860 [Streptomyces griseoluteus]|uniref:hypothetical protein n=1 Tax=Streptomyces griseoluteus TaxID=29306 RepID=UPI003403EC6E